MISFYIRAIAFLSSRARFCSSLVSAYLKGNFFQLIRLDLVVVSDSPANLALLQSCSKFFRHTMMVRQTTLHSSEIYPGSSALVLSSCRHLPTVRHTLFSLVAQVVMSIRGRSLVIFLSSLTDGATAYRVMMRETHTSTNWLELEFSFRQKHLVGMKSIPSLDTDDRDIKRLLELAGASIDVGQRVRIWERNLIKKLLSAISWQRA